MSAAQILSRQQIIICLLAIFLVGLGSAFCTDTEIHEEYPISNALGAIDSRGELRIKYLLESVVVSDSLLIPITISVDSSAPLKSSLGYPYTIDIADASAVLESESSLIIRGVNGNKLFLSKSEDDGRLFKGGSFTAVISKNSITLTSRSGDKNFIFVNGRIQEASVGDQRVIWERSGNNLERITINGRPIVQFEYNANKLKLIETPNNSYEIKYQSKNNSNSKDAEGRSSDKNDVINLTSSDGRTLNLAINDNSELFTVTTQIDQQLPRKFSWIRKTGMCYSEPGWIYHFNNDENKIEIERQNALMEKESTLIEPSAGKTTLTSLDNEVITYDYFVGDTALTGRVRKISVDKSSKNETLKLSYDEAGNNIPSQIREKANDDGGAKSAEGYQVRAFAPMVHGGGWEVLSEKGASKALTYFSDMDSLTTVTKEEAVSKRGCLAINRQEDGSLRGTIPMSGRENRYIYDKQTHLVTDRQDGMGRHWSYEYGDNKRVSKIRLDGDLWWDALLGFVGNR